jgi:hypothetical protein
MTAASAIIERQAAVAVTEPANDFRPCSGVIALLAAAAGDL